MSFINLQNEDQRFYILLSLINTGFDANINMLVTCLDVYGHRVSIERMENHLQWLAQYELVTLSKVGHITKAELTRKGQDVAEGRESIIGVRRPLAGEI